LDALTPFLAKVHVVLHVGEAARDGRVLGGDGVGLAARLVLRAAVAAALKRRPGAREETCVQGRHGGWTGNRLFLMVRPEAGIAAAAAMADLPDVLPDHAASRRASRSPGAAAKV